MLIAVEGLERELCITCWKLFNGSYFNGTPYFLFEVCCSLLII